LYGPNGRTLDRSDWVRSSLHGFDGKFLNEAFKFVFVGDLAIVEPGVAAKLN